MARETDERGSSLSWPDDSPGGTVLARTTGSTTVVELHGEIDLAVVLATTPQLYALTVGAVPALVADLRAVTFIDCSGLAMLVDIRSRVLAGGGGFTMVCADPKVLRLLKITGLTSVLEPVTEPGPGIPVHGSTGHGLPGHGSPGHGSTGPGPADGTPDTEVGADADAGADADVGSGVGREV